MVRPISLPSDRSDGQGVVDLLLSSLHSALKEFFDPLRTNDSRTDFFAMYRRESEEFDRDYARKYDEDLNTSLIFVSRRVPISPCRTLNMTVHRQVCSPQLIRRSSSTSNQTYSPIRTR